MVSIERLLELGGWDVAEVTVEALRVVPVHPAEDIEAVAHAFNTRPRKTLGWTTPAEAFNEQLLLLQQASVASTG